MRHVSLVVGVLLAGISVVPAQQNQVAEAMKKAGQKAQQGDWTGAAEAYREAVDLNPEAPWSWYLLGTALHQATDHEGAIEAWKKSLDLGISVPGVSEYNLACAYAKLGSTEQALEHLAEAAGSSLYTAESFDKDPDLESIRSEARYDELGKEADLAHHPCLLKEEYRQFDYWVGKWVGRIPAGFKAGDNEIVKTSRGCVLEQTWDGVFGLTGRSYSYYEPASGQWVQTWIGQGGTPATMRGGLKNGAMTLEGRLPGPNGLVRPIRTAWIPNDDGSITVLTEDSPDEGRTWNKFAELLLVKAE